MLPCGALSTRGIAAMAIAQWVVNLAMIYAALGVAFAIAFVIFGVGKIDPAAKGTSLLFRLLILPGTVALWPLLVKRWLGGQAHPPREKNPHRQVVREVKQ